MFGVAEQSKSPSRCVCMHTCVPARVWRLQRIACFCLYSLVHPVWFVPFSPTHTLHYLVTNRNVNYKKCGCKKNTHTQGRTQRLMNGKKPHIPFINPSECTFILCAWTNCAWAKSRQEIIQLQCCDWKGFNVAHPALKAKPYTARLDNKLRSQWLVFSSGKSRNARALQMHFTVQSVSCPWEPIQTHRGSICPCNL